MNKLYLLIMISLITSCSTLRKTIIYSSLAGGVTGSLAGATLSPDKESVKANAAIFGLLGAGIAGFTGYALYKDDPRNYKLKNMLLENKVQEINDPNLINIDLNNLKIDANLKSKEKYEVPLKKLPKKLQGKVSKQFMIRHQAKERYVKKGNKTYFIPAFEIYEHGYNNTPEGGTDDSK